MKTIPKRCLSRALLILPIMAITAGPAHAINAHYRAQLEASGCTQLDEGVTCDLHKTKAQNAEHQAKTEEIKVMIGQPIADAAERLLAEGWKPNEGHWYQGDKMLNLLVVDGIIQHARLEPRSDR